MVDRFWNLEKRNNLIITEKDIVNNEVLKSKHMEYTKYDITKVEEINHLFIKTFSDSEGESEGLVIGALTNSLLTSTDTNDFYCFVATENDEIVGGVIFSRLTFESGIKAYILSPMATSTKHQGKGIGQKLINFGLNTLKEDGVELAVTYGDPNFYSKVGFSVISEKIIPAPLKLSYPEGWLGQSLVSDIIDPILGKSYCVEALNKPDLW